MTEYKCPVLWIRKRVSQSIAQCTMAWILYADLYGVAAFGAVDLITFVGGFCERVWNHYSNICAARHYYNY